MKLSNQQIEAIVNSVKAETNKKIAKEEADIKSRKDVQQEAKKYYNLLLTIPSEVRRVAYLDKKLNQLIEGVVSMKKLHPKTERVSAEALKDKIILASIDSATIEELKNKMGITF